MPGPVGATLACPSPTCRIPFRDARRAARLSALIPGLGDLYLGLAAAIAWVMLTATPA